MTTARDLVYDAMSLIGALGQGDVAPSDSDAQLCIRALNRLIGSWANDSLMAYVTTQETITLVAADSTYTTLNLSTPTRPVAVEAAFIRWQGVDSPLRSVTAYEFDEFAYKPADGIPDSVLYKPFMADGTFEFYPVPNAAMTAYFNVRRALTGTLVLATVLSLPPGYERALVANLAVEAAPMFGMEAKPSVVQAARLSKVELARQNYVPRILSTPFDGDRERHDIFTG